MLALLPRGVSSPGAASHQSSNSSYGSVVFSRCPPGSTGRGVKARAGLHRWVRHPSVGHGTNPPNKGPGRWKALSADQQAQFQRTRQKKELRAQSEQRLTSRIHPGQSCPRRGRRSADPRRCRRCRSRALPWDPLHTGDPGYPHPRGRWMSSREQSTATAEGFLFARQERERRPGKRLPAAPLPDTGRNQNNLLSQPLHSLKVQHIYSYKLMLNRLDFLFFCVFFYQQIVPLLSPLAAAKGLLLQLV